MNKKSLELVGKGSRSSKGKTSSNVSRHLELQKKSFFSDLGYRGDELFEIELRYEMSALVAGIISRNELTPENVIELLQLKSNKDKNAVSSGKFYEFSSGKLYHFFKLLGGRPLIYSRSVSQVAQGSHSNHEEKHLSKLTNELLDEPNAGVASPEETAPRKLPPIPELEVELKEEAARNAENEAADADDDDVMFL